MVQVLQGSYFKSVLYSHVQSHAWHTDVPKDLWCCMVHKSMMSPMTPKDSRERGLLLLLIFNFTAEKWTRQSLYSAAHPNVQCPLACWPSVTRHILKFLFPRNHYKPQNQQDSHSRWLRRKTTSQNQTRDEKRSCWSSLLCSCTELSQTETVLERTRKPQWRRNLSTSTRWLSAVFLHQGKSETGPGCWCSPGLCQEPGCCSTPDPRLWKEAWRKCISEFWWHTQVLSSKSCRP